MRDLYPDPPHLAVSLYSENLSEDAAFAALCRAVQEADGIPTGTLQVFPRSHDFCWASELTDVSQTQTVAEDVFWLLIDGKDPQTRVAKTGFTAGTPGLVVVALESTGDNDQSRHPVAAWMYADQLGIPVHLVPASSRPSQQPSDIHRSGDAGASDPNPERYTGLISRPAMPTLGRLQGGDFGMLGVDGSEDLGLLEDDPAFVRIR